jgi:hypothetical protein
MIEFTHLESGEVVGTLDPESMATTGEAGSWVEAKRGMGWDDEKIVALAESWSNGYYGSRRVDAADPG